MILPYAFGYGPFRQVVGHGAQPGLPEAELRAIEMHELGHLFYGHPGKRLLRLLNPLLWPRLAALARQDELDADAFAARHGHARALAGFLCRVRDQPHPFYPTASERLLALTPFFNRPAGVTGNSALHTSRAALEVSR